MAWARGTATDFIDFLRKLRDYAAGTIDPATDPDINQGVQVPLSDRWTVLANGAGMPALPASGFATDGEVYLQGPGSDPADQIFVGFKTYRNAGNNIFGWEMRGFTAYSNLLTFTTLPGVSPPSYAAFDDAAFSAFFWVNSRRIMALARIGTTDILVHLGFIQQFATRSQYPYPLLISGPISASTLSFQDASYNHSSLPDPCTGSTNLRWIDGSWGTVRNYNTGGSSRASARDSTIGAFHVWPLVEASVSNGADALTTNNEQQLFESWTTSSVQLSPNEISAYSLFRALIYSSTQIPGRIEGLFAVPGLGLVAGDTITIASGANAGTYDIFKNCWRSEPLDFFAVKRE